MGLSLQQKRTMYRELGQLLRAGKPLPAALEVLASSSSGSLRAFQKRLQKSLAKGDSIPEAFAKQHAAIGKMEVSMLAAGGRSGRLMESCERLANYFHALEKARAAIWKKCAYPLFVFHFGAFTLGLPTLVSGGGLSPYLKQTLTMLGTGYGIALVPLFIGGNLLSLAQSIPIADQILLSFPGFGKVRRGFSLARFCSTYDAQLDAGVNVMESLQTAADASRSAVVIHGIARQIAALRGGAQVGEIIAKISVFPQWMVRGWRVAEETGGLDQELPRMAAELETQAISRVETLSEWIPRLIYLAIMALLGWKIISLYQGVTASYGKLLE
jgi:type IV pilus assembly protein PilC